MTSDVAGRPIPGAEPERATRDPKTVDEIYGLLRTGILRGTYPAGSVLSQVKLAEQIGVNRTPLREALRMLQREKLVDAQLNRKVRISPLTSGDLADLYSMRIVHEALAIRLTVPHLNRDTLAEISELLDAMSEVASIETFEEWETLHTRFHKLLISQAGERISASANDLGDYCARYRRALLQLRPINFAIGAREHREIADACLRGDAVQAAVALAKHLSTTALTLVAITDPTFDPVSVRRALEHVLCLAQ